MDRKDRARPSEQALVSDQAAARLDPPGFDPSRTYDEFKLPEWCVGRVPVISRERAAHKETLRLLVERLDAAGDREASDTIVWLMWWRCVSDNRSQFFADQLFVCDNTEPTLHQDKPHDHP